MEKQNAEEKISPKEEFFKKGTYIHKECNEELLFEIRGSMRISRDGFFNTVCPKCNRYFKVKA